MTLTPEQFNQLATKDDLKALVSEQKFQDKTDKIVNKLFTLEDRVEKIEQTMVTKQDHNEVMNTLDAVMKKLDTIEHAFVFNQAAHDRFEQRITKIEQHLGINPYNIVINNA